jgi:hypothetical protein
MTRITAYTTIVTKCCRQMFATPKYGSINLSALAYWTDGYNEGSLFSIGGGLRKCNCGSFYLLKDAIFINLDANGNTPNTIRLDEKDLPNAIESTTSKELEIEARREYWRLMNHTYRDNYRAYRTAEDRESIAKWKADWHKTNPDQSTKFKRWTDLIFHGNTPSLPPVNVKKPINFPPYSPTEPQFENLTRLLGLILDSDGADMLEVAEIYRELSNFNEANVALKLSSKDHRITLKQVIEQMLQKKINAPVRYKL